MLFESIENSKTRHIWIFKFEFKVQFNFLLSTFQQTLTTTQKIRATLPFHCNFAQNNTVVVMKNCYHKTREKGT